MNFVQKNDSDIFLRWLGDKGTQKDATRRQDYPPWKASYIHFYFNLFKTTTSRHRQWALESVPTVEITSGSATASERRSSVTDERCIQRTFFKCKRSTNFIRNTLRYYIQLTCLKEAFGRKVLHPKQKTPYLPMSHSYLTHNGNFPLSPRTERGLVREPDPFLGLELKLDYLAVKLLLLRGFQ